VNPLVNLELAGTTASANGDVMLGNIHFSLDEDARWHRDWSAAPVRMTFGDTQANRDVVAAWIAKWEPLAARAVHALAQVTADAPIAADPAAIAARLRESAGEETSAFSNRLQRCARHTNMASGEQRGARAGERPRRD
jgi:toluene monooxygenase system protein E